MTRVSRVFEPDPERQATYDALYEQVYSRMYQRLQPLYEKLNALTRVPRLF
ncbi:MAG: hypothetical protein IT325_08405 [Anaerolineae bacterium]|nr:hypothetical protein [Anaerolineae bacterium]